MANYIGLQGIFNALAGGGANAVNIYAQEKDRQRRLVFDERKFEADQAHRKNVLGQDKRRLDLADRQMDHTEAVYRDQEEAARRKELIERQTKIAGNAGTLAGQRGYNDRFSFLMSDDHDAHLMLEASVGNLASKERKVETQVKLVEAGVNEQGEKLYQTTFMGKKGKTQNFGPVSTKAQLAGQVRAMNVSYGIVDHLAAAGVGIQTKPDGQKVLVNDKSKTPELDAEQQQVVAELEDLAQQSLGTGLQDVLDNPPERAVQEALAQEDVDPPEGLTYEGMPAGERYAKPRNLGEFYEREFAGTRASIERGVEAVNNLPHIKAYDAAGGGLKGAVAGTASVVGQAAKDLASVPGEAKKGLRWVGGKISDAAGFVAENVAQGYNGEAVQPAEPEAEQQEQGPATPKTNTTPAAEERAEKAAEQVANPETSPRRRAAIFASQVQAAGGDMSNPNTRKMYQGLLNPQTSAGLSAEAARLLSEQRALRKEQKEIAGEQADRNMETIGNFSQSFSEGEMAGMGFSSPEDITYNVMDTAAKNKSLLATAGLPTDPRRMNDTQLARYLDMVKQSMRANNKSKGFWSSGKTNTEGSLSNNIIPAEIAAKSFFESRTPAAQNDMIKEAGSVEAAIRQLSEDFKAQRAKEKE